jgi:hypothetical protein
MRDSDAHTSQFSPDTPRKSRPRADLSLSLPPLLVGRARKKQTTSAEKEQQQQRQQSPIFSLAQLPIDVGVIIVSKLPVKSKAHLTMVENKELARWVRQGLFEESSSCARRLSKQKKKSGKSATEEEKEDEEETRSGRNKKQRLFFSPFREETSEGIYGEASDEDVRLYVKAMAERCEISERMRASLVAGLLNSSESGRRGKDRVTEMAKLPMGLRRLKQLTNAREREYGEVEDVEDEEEEGGGGGGGGEEHAPGEEQGEGFAMVVGEGDVENVVDVDHDDGEEEFSIIEGDTLRRECENLRAVVEKWSPEKIGETLALVLEKELQTFRTTKEARDRTGEEEVRRMLEQEREKERIEEEGTHGTNDDANDDPFGTPRQFDAFHFNAPADYEEEMAAYREDGAFENDVDDSDDEDTTNDERRFDWKIALDSICDARIYTFVHFCLGTPDFSHLTERIDTKKANKTSETTLEAWKRIKIGVSKMIQVAFKSDIESEERSNIINNNDVFMDIDDNNRDSEDENGILFKGTNRVIVEKASALLALLTQHCATFQSVNLLDIPGSAQKTSTTSATNTTNPAAFSHLGHFGDRGRENPFFESNMFATKIGGSCMMQHLDYSRGDDATMYFDQNISMTSLFMFGIEEDDDRLSSKVVKHTSRSMDTFRMDSKASPLDDTRNVFDTYRDQIITRLIEYWDDSFVLFFMARSAGEAMNLASKKRKRLENTRSSSRLSTRRVSRRRTNSSPGVEEEEGSINNALRAFKTDTQQRFASWLSNTEGQKHLERSNARKFQKLSSAISKLFQRSEIYQRDINRVTNYIASTVKSKDIWSLKNKIFNDAIETCAEEMVMVGCGDASCCPPKLHEVLREKVLKLAKIGYAAMSVIVEREDDKMSNKDPSGEIVVPHSWTL